MTISTKGRYALRMMVDMALHTTDDFITLKAISERQNISKKYLEQIVPLLSRSNLIRSNRGNKGGYALVKSISDYTVAEILEAAEGKLSPVACINSDSAFCEKMNTCMTRFIWEGLYQVTTDYLKSITLLDIIQRHNNGADSNYCI